MIDLRSDTVTQPCPKMRAAMAAADTGDDVYGEDPTVNALETYAAELTGKEAALFASSGTQTNLLALLSHCQRGHEYIVGATAHTYMYEGGGAAVLGGIQPCVIPFAASGELPLPAIKASVKPDDAHFAITRTVCLENTHAGKVLSASYLQAFSDLVQELGLIRHLDGARAFNAAVSQGCGIADICQHFDSVSLCLSKGLAAPVGSVLVGDAHTIAQARRWRKMLGGGMRQAGIIAAAGLYALQHNVQRLAEDHRRTAELAVAIDALEHVHSVEAPQTNMLYLHPDTDLARLTPFMAERGITLTNHRLVLHRDIDDGGLDQVVEGLRAYDVALGSGG